MRRRSWMAALALVPLVAGPAWCAETDYEELLADYDEARAEHSAELRALRAADDMEAYQALRDQSPALAFVPRFQEGAEEHAGKEAAVPFLAWIVMNGVPRGSEDTQPALSALTTLQGAHVKSEAISELVSRMRFSARTLGNEPCLAFLDAVVAATPHVPIEAQALFGRGTMRLSGDPSAEVKAQAIADMRRVMELVPGSDSASRAESTIFQAERLQIGMVAPDIEGEDLLGVSFKLSDYRGKVVVIDFWGDW